MGSSELLLKTVGVVVTFWILNLLYKRYKFRKIVDKIPGPAGMPIFGFSSEFFKQIREDYFIAYFNIKKKELREVFGDSKKPVTQKDVANLHYLDRVVKETLRRYATVPIISRQLIEDIKIGNYILPKGCTICIKIRQTHLDPEVWKDPLTFDPDCFLPENLKKQHPFAFVPFSAGPRNCLGQKFAMLEIKIILATILRKWSVKSVLKHSEMKVVFKLIMKPYYGVNLYFTPK